MFLQYRHCPFTPALKFPLSPRVPHNRSVSAERRTIVPRVPREASRNYNSQWPPRRGGVDPEL